MNMTSAQRYLTTLTGVFCFAASVLMLIAVAGCGDQQASDVGATEIAVAVSLSDSSNTGAPQTAKATGDNLLDLNGAWPTWSGRDSGISYDEETSVLHIPGDGSDVVSGVRRFDTALTAGVNYTLSVNSAEPQSAAVLFLFDTSGSIVPVPGVNGLASARDGAEVTFAAPENIAGFYLQVQNQYQATSESTVRAELIEGDGGGGTSRGDNLINANGTWLDWSGNATGINGTSGTISIPAPANAESIVHGVMRYKAALTAGAEYELAALAGSTPGTAVLLFLIDASGQIMSFSGDGQSTPWLSAAPGVSRHFSVPEGIASYVIQVQSPLGSREGSVILPSLTTASGGDATTCEAPVVTVTMEFVGQPEGPIVTDPPVQISADGRYETFRESSYKPTDPDVAYQYTYLRDKLTGVDTLLDATETRGNRRSLASPQISANGQYVFYMRNEDRDGDGNELAPYLYRYDIQRNTYVSAPGTLGNLRRVSANGRIATTQPRIVYQEVGVGIVRFTETCE